MLYDAEGLHNVSDATALPAAVSSWTAPVAVGTRPHLKLAIKRGFDFVAALALIIFFAPLLIVITVAILAIDRVRAHRLDFTPPLVVLEGTYVTREPSPCSTVLDLDRVGMRISIVRDTVFDAHLTHSLRHAELIRSPTFQGAVDRFLAEGLDAVAGLKQQMAAFVEVNAGLRVMEGRFMAIEPAFAVPKGHSAGLRYLNAFVEELKASRRVADALQFTSITTSH